MNRSLAFAGLLAVATLTAACTQKPVATKPADNVAVVDGRAISRSTYNAYVKGAAGKPAADLTEAQRKELLENLVRAQVVAAAAEAGGVAAQEETRAVLELSRLNVLTQAATENHLKGRKATDAELQAEYQLQLAGMAKTEYRASHILVPTEEAAMQIIAQLKAGANFAGLARRVSADAVSRERGGDLDWFVPKNMTPVFGQAVAALKKGETSTTPVKTEYGWHVLRVTDTRDVVPPPFESVKDRLSQLVDARKFKTHVDELVAKARITKSL